MAKLGLCLAMLLVGNGLLICWVRNGIQWFWCWLGDWVVVFGETKEKGAGEWGLLGAFFTAIIGPAGYSPSAGERRVEIYLCVDAGGGRC